jgi:hypothetical protein
MQPQQNQLSPTQAAQQRRGTLGQLWDRGIFLLIVILLFISAGTIIDTFIWPKALSIGVPVVNGPSASWDTMLAIAEREATKIDKAALLGPTVYASPPNIMRMSNYTDTLELKFSYRTPSGDEIQIRFQDASPTSTLRISTMKGVAEGLYEQDRQAENTKRLVAPIKVTPREAVEHTWAEVLDYAQRQGISNPQVTLLASLWTPESKGLAWDLAYGMKDPNQPTPDFTKRPIVTRLGLNARFLVDAKTGTIVEREFKDRRSETVTTP